MTLVGLLLTSVSTIPAANAQTAAMFLGCITRLGERTGDTLSPFHQRLIAERALHAQQLIPEPEWQAAWQIGYRWTQPQALTEAEQWLALAHNG